MLMNVINNNQTSPRPSADHPETTTLSDEVRPPGSQVSTRDGALKRKRIKIKGWIWKQLHSINVGAGERPCRVHCGRSPPAERKDVQRQKLEGVWRGWRGTSHWTGV